MKKSGIWIMKNTFKKERKEGRNNLALIEVLLYWFRFVKNRANSENKEKDLATLCDKVFFYLYISAC